MNTGVELKQQKSEMTELGENNMQISDEGVMLVKKFEGCKLEAYQCAAGVWTIGYGHTRTYYKRAFRTKTFAKGYGDVTYHHSTEAFAQYTALSNTKNKEAYIKLMNYFAPNTTKTFDQIMERSKLL